MVRLFARLIAIGLLPMSAVRAGAADVDVDVHIGIPPPPAIVFDTEPEVVVVPQTQVYYVPRVVEYDMYRYGKYWYVNREGHWYRSHGYRGPFKHVEFRHVPQVIVGVPVEYRHHPRHPARHKRYKHKHKHHDDD
jgi:hypothetical protein